MLNLNHRIIGYIIGIGFLFNATLTAQVILPDTFADNLNHLNIDFVYPLEANYKPIKPRENEFLDCAFSILSRKEKLEVRYAIAPFNENEPTDQYPDMKAFTLVSHLATNDETAVITKLAIGEESLLEDFNADWGTVFNFKPKGAFSEKEHCQMLALYKEGQAFAYVFFLFDDPNNEALDYRFYALRFRDL